MEKKQRSQRKLNLFTAIMALMSAQNQTGDNVTPLTTGIRGSAFGTPYYAGTHANRKKKVNRHKFALKRKKRIKHTKWR